MLCARRLSSIAVVAAVGVMTLAGCRSDPSVAAYVGPTQIDDARIVRIVDEFVATAPEDQRGGLNKETLKDQVLHFLVLSKAAGDYAEANDIDVQDPDVEGIAQQQGLKPDIELTEVLAQYSATLSALSGAAKPVAPSEADRREAYDHTTVQNQPLQQPYDEVKEFFNQETLGQSLGLREILTTALADADVTVNPRYNATYRLPVQIENATSWFAVDLGGAAPVRDAPQEPAPAEGASGQG
jgi:hypothetical protein